MMHDDKWDEQMRRLLNDVESEYDPTSWDQLSDKLDDLGDELGDELFDDIIKEKLGPHKATNIAPDWSSMESALIESERRQQNIISTKAFEAVIVILAVFTLWNYRTHTAEIKVDDSYVNTIIAQNEVLENVIADLSHTIIEEQLTVDKHQALTQATINTKQAYFLKELISETLDGSPMQQPSSIQPTSLSPVAPITLSHTAIQPVALLDIDPLALDVSVSVIPPVTPPAQQPEIINSFDGWTAGIAQSYDANFVNSDITLGFLGDQIRSGLSGHTVALTTAYRKGPIEISTGIGYSAKAFAPGQLTEYHKASANSSAFLQSQLDEINFKQIQIPLAAKLFLAPKSKISGYITAGIVANALLETNYTVRRSIQANARPASDPRVNVLDLSKPPLGLGNGGNIRDNFYTTGMVGIGVQSYLSNGVSWYLQPQYQVTLSPGINAVANEINTFSFSAGLQFSL